MTKRPVVGALPATDLPSVRNLHPATVLHPERLDHADCEHRLEETCEKVRKLETALLTASHLYAAVGIVMATYRVNYDAALELLVVASERSGRELTEIARQTVATGELKWAPLERRERRSSDEAP